MRSAPARRFRFPYVEACIAAGADELDLGDRITLSWRGELRAPVLAREGGTDRRPAIVVELERDRQGYAFAIVVSLIEEGRPAELGSIEPVNSA